VEAEAASVTVEDVETISPTVTRETEASVVEGLGVMELEFNTLADATRPSTVFEELVRALVSEEVEEISPSEATEATNPCTVRDVDDVDVLSPTAAVVTGVKWISAGVESVTEEDVAGSVVRVVEVVNVTTVEDVPTVTVVTMVSVTTLPVVAKSTAVVIEAVALRACVVTVELDTLAVSPLEGATNTIAFGRGLSDVISIRLAEVTFAIFETAIAPCEVLVFRTR